MISAPLFLTIAFYPIIQGILSRKKLTIMNDPKKETALCSEPTLIEGGKEGGYWGSKMDTSFTGSLQVHYKFSDALELFCRGSHSRGSGNLSWT